MSIKYVWFTNKGFFVHMALTVQWFRVTMKKSTVIPVSNNTLCPCIIYKSYLISKSNFLYFSSSKLIDSLTRHVNKWEWLYSAWIKLESLL